MKKKVRLSKEDYKKYIELRKQLNASRTAQEAKANYEKVRRLLDEKSD